jgi:hypothetical protein
MHSYSSSNEFLNEKFGMDCIIIFITYFKISNKEFPENFLLTFGDEA